MKKQSMSAKISLTIVSILTVGITACGTTSEASKSTSEDSLTGGGKGSEKMIVDNGERFQLSGELKTHEKEDKTSGATPSNQVSFDMLSLDPYEYQIIIDDKDTSIYHSFKFHVRNSSDSLAVIDRAVPSCGCIMATVQKSFVRKGKDGEVFVAVRKDKMSDTQPYTIDIYTTANPSVPLTLYITKVKGDE